MVKIQSLVVRLAMICSCVMLLHAAVAQQKYYIAAGGNDSNDGNSFRTAWRSLDKINSTDFNPGDSIFLEGSAVLKGTIKLSAADNGAKGKSVVITSYGKGKAIVDAADGDGFFADNASHLTLSSLIFRGSGVEKNNGSGIHFYANDSTEAPSGIDIADCDVKGFRNHGITIGCNDKEDYKGYQHVRITHCTATENGNAGFASYGSQKAFQHRNFYMSHCKAFGNRGIITRTDGHSGNGIVMGMVDGLLIEHCEAYDNGADNRCNDGGPVGIWVWMCRNAIIQYCTSHDNHTGSTKDGGGFDIDGGASDCVIQYNYSYNNDGAGYLLAEYGALFPFTNNVIRFNISVNDGRKNGYGAITVWGADSLHRVTNSYVYNNTIYMDDKNVVNGIPAVVSFMGPNFQHVVIANNIFTVGDSAHFINSDEMIKKPQAWLLHNNYYAYNSRYIFKYGTTTHNSLRDWLAANTDQERPDSKKMVLNTDPKFAAKPFRAADAKGLVLQQASPLRKETFTLSTYVDVHQATDMGGYPLLADKKIFPGAYVK